METIDLRKVPTHVLATRCKVTTLEAWNWKESGEVPNNHVDVVKSTLSALAMEAEKKDSLELCLRLAETDQIGLFYNTTRKRPGWELINAGPDTTTRALLMGRGATQAPEVSLATWLAEEALRTRGIDILWSYVEVGTSYQKPVLNISYPNGKKEKVTMATDLPDLIGNHIGKGPQVKDFYIELFSAIRGIVDDAREKEGLEKVRSILDMVQEDPEAIYKRELERICQEFCTRHFSGFLQPGGSTSKREPIYTTVGGRKYVGNTYLTSSQVGTYFKEIDESAKNDIILYTGSGYKMGTILLDNLHREGLTRLVPEIPEEDPEMAGSAYLWLMPNAPALSQEAAELSGVHRTPETALRELLMQLLETIKDVITTSAVVAREPEAGVTYLDNPSITVAKINKEAFTVFGQHPRSRPFRVFSAHFAAGEKTFWAMLYSSLIPTKGVRKQALCLFGSGGSFKSTFLGDVYARMLGATIRKTSKGGFRFKRNPQAGAIFTRTRSEDSQRADVFGDPSAPNNVALWFEELEAFNIEGSEFRNLKKQLGQNHMTMNVKYARSRMEVPVSRTVLIDSNYPPANFTYSKESVDRCAECVVFSQYSLVPPDQTYQTTSGNRHLYFQELLTQSERQEMQIVLSLKPGKEPTTDDYFDYLAFLLFRDIMTYGKKCYAELTETAPCDKLPTFVPFQDCQYNRKELALAYCKLMQLDKLTRRRGEGLSPYTVLQYFFRAGIRENPDSFLSWDKIEDFLLMVLPDLKAGFDSKNVGKEELRSRIMNNYIQGAWLGKDSLGKFLGRSETGYQPYHVEGGIQGIEFEPWMTRVLNSYDPKKNRGPLKKDGTVLAALQQQIQELLRVSYFKKLVEAGLMEFLPLRKPVTNQTIREDEIDAITTALLESDSF